MQQDRLSTGDRLVLYTDGLVERRDRGLDEGLDLLAAKLTELQAQGQSAVLACSALKPAYRQRLGVDECHVRSVLLTGSPALLAARLALRQHAFMAASLLQSQLVTLEPSAASLMVDINQSPEAIIHSMIETLHLDQDSAS